MHHLFINLHVKYKYNNYLHTHTHAHAARSHTRSSWHLPFTKHRRFLQQKKYQKVQIASYRQTTRVTEHFSQQNEILNFEFRDSN